jgi:formate--tetrahydrofolate ligase
MENLDRHIYNLQHHYGVTPIVSINRFDTDTELEIRALTKHVEAQGVAVTLATHWAHGGEGAIELAKMVAEACDSDDRSAHECHHKFVYEDGLSLWQKIEAVTSKLYGASEVTASTAIRRRLRELVDEGYGQLPICIAKTPYSFSTDPQLRGAPSNHSVNIREVRLSVGAGFIVLVCGEIMTMPGLPKTPASESIDVVEGRLTGLF